MRKWLGHFFIKVLLVLNSYIATSTGYICSLALYRLADTKVLVVGDYHHYCQDDREHRFQLHDFFETLKRKNEKVAVVLEGNYVTTAKLSTTYTTELLLPATWLYAYRCSESNLVFHFADPRIELHKLFREFSTNNFHAYSRMHLYALFDEYRTCVEEFRSYRSFISEHHLKFMLELMNLKIDTGLQAIKEYSILKSNMKDEQVLELKDAITQSYLDIADMSFCIRLHQLLNETNALIVLVGDDHTIRLNYMLESLGYKATQLVSESYADSPLLKPVALSDIHSYFSAFLD